MKKIIVILLMSVSVMAQAMMVFDPSNLAQNTLAAKNTAQSIIQQALMIQNQMKSLTMEMQNLETVPNYQWRAMANLMQQVDDLSRQGQSVSYNMKNLDAQFQKLYPDYAKQTNPVDYQKSYQTWNTTSLTTMNNSLQGIGLTMDQLKNEETVLKKMQSQSQNAQGRMQVLQVSNEIAFENVRQLQSLQRVVAVQANAQTAYMAHQVSSKAQQDAEMDLILANIPDKYDDEGPGFGEIKMP